MPVLLKVLAEQGPARPDQIYPLVTKEFPEITPEDLTVVLSDGRTPRWRNRIQWARQNLVLEGLVAREPKGIWQLTAEGIARAAGPTEERPASPDEPDAPIVDDGEQEGGRKLPVSVLKNPAETLSDELEEASADSRDPRRLESAVADAFAYLGFDTQMIGGAGNTDVLLIAPLGVRRYTVVVDAKSTGRQKISDAQVDWLSMQSHRERHAAEYTMVVGSGFAGGNLTARATQFGVSLLTVEDLKQIISAHSVAPLTLTELRPLFEATPSAHTAIPQVLAASKERHRIRLLVHRLLAHIDKFNSFQPDLVLAKPDTLLASILGEGNSELGETTLEDVRRTLALLETVGAISRANGEGYVSNTTEDGAKQLLQSFGSLAVSSEVGAEGSVSTSADAS
jgi:hypothetical protein